MSDTITYRLNRMPRELPLSFWGKARRNVAAAIRHVAEAVDVKTEIVWDRAAEFTVGGLGLQAGEWLKPRQEEISEPRKEYPAPT